MRVELVRCVVMWSGVRPYLILNTHSRSTPKQQPTSAPSRTNQATDRTNNAPISAHLTPARPHEDHQPTQRTSNHKLEMTATKQLPARDTCSHASTSGRNLLGHPIWSHLSAGSRAAATFTACVSLSG